MKLSKQELEAKYKKIYEDSDVFTFRSIEGVNHKPHPFTIGSRHVAYAADHCCGMLGDEVLKKIPCAAPGCGRRYEEHTYDVVMFLSLKRNADREEAQAELKRAIDAGLEADEVDGFCFVETDERYRITSPTEDAE